MRLETNRQQMLWSPLNEIWDELPNEAQVLCQKRLSQILIKVVIEEGKTRSVNHERKDSVNPS